LVAHVQRDFCFVQCFGDGVIVAIRHDGKLQAHNIQFQGGETGNVQLPYYLSYAISDSSRLAWRNGNVKKTVDSFLIDPEKGTYTSQAPIDGTTDQPETYFAFSRGQYKAVLLFSDGLSSFVETVRSATSVTKKAIPFQDVLLKMGRFNNFNGEFIRRRVTRFFKDVEALASPWSHEDDFSVGGIYLGENVNG
jgi:hypothetical protein